MTAFVASCQKEVGIQLMRTQYVENIQTSKPVKEEIAKVVLLCRGAIGTD